jgi:histidinol-phosphate aminotransferase
MTDSTRRAFLRTVGAGAAVFAARPVYSPQRAFAAVGGRRATLPGPVHLNFNESPYGPSPKAIAAYRSASADVIGRYAPEDHYDTLCAALAKHHGVTPAHIRVTPGSTEVLKVCDDVFLSAGAPVVVAEPAYEAVLQYAANSHANATKVPLTPDFRHDLVKMAAATTTKTGLIYICNPNNPTGTIVRKDDISRLLDRIPKSVTVLVDEAYAEFVDDPGYESAVRHVKDGRNVIVAKTFSKIHGMAGARVGYAIAAPETIKKLTPFTVDFAVTGASANAALASMADTTYRADVTRRNAIERSRFAAEMRKAGYVVAESQANFAMVNLKRPVGPVISGLAARQVLVGREFPAMPTFLRVTFGTTAEMDAFYPAFAAVMKG